MTDAAGVRVAQVQPVDARDLEIRFDALMCMWYKFLVIVFFFFSILGNGIFSVKFD